jgi:hypothetical protein
MLELLLLLLWYLCHKSAFQDEEEEEEEEEQEEQEEECTIMCLLSQVCLPERKTKKEEVCRKFCFSFVASWSLSVVCRSFERNGNACLYVCLFFSSFRLQVLAGSCRGDACPQAATISATTTTTHPLWYLTTTCCRLGRACMASMTCATITGKDSSVSLSLSLSLFLSTAVVVVVLLEHCQRNCCLFASSSFVQFDDASRWLACGNFPFCRDSSFDRDRGLSSSLCVCVCVCVKLLPRRARFLSQSKQRKTIWEE